MTTKKRIIDWNFIHTAVDRLCLNILKSGIKVNAVYGLARGGLIPAVMISHRLKLPFMSIENADKDYDKILIVDDICDSGDTLKRFIEYPDEIVTATIHYKSSSVYEPNFWYRLAYEDEWIVYPWETKDSEMIQDYKLHNYDR